MIRRLATAMLLGAGLVIGSGARPVAACQWLPPQLEEVATAGVDTLFVGRVAEIPAARTYVVDVLRVFRGDPAPQITFAPWSTEAISSCEAGLDLGATYLFAPSRIDGVLGIGDVWARIEGQEVSAIYVQEWTGSADALYAYLEGLPDTAVPLPRRASDPVLLVGILLVGFAARSARRAVQS